MLYIARQEQSPVFRKREALLEYLERWAIECERVRLSATSDPHFESTAFLRGMRTDHFRITAAFMDVHSY
jgi:hypothetical protein